jgi:hypothetical protein
MPVAKMKRDMVWGFVVIAVGGGAAGAQK